MTVVTMHGTRHAAARVDDDGATITACGEIVPEPVERSRWRDWLAPFPARDGDRDCLFCALLTAGAEL